MSDQQRGRQAGQSEGIKVPWGTVFCWAGICLLRLIPGAVIWGIPMYSGVLLVQRYYPDIETLGETPTWYRFIFALLPVLLIASVAFLPLWRGWENTSIRGRNDIVVAARNLLIPAILLQVIAAWNVGLGLGVANFLAVVVVCFLVTLAMDFERRIQFVALLIGGTQAIAVTLIVFVLLDLDTPLDGWQVKAASWLGAVPPIGLMVVLFKQSRQVLSDYSSQSLMPSEEEIIQ